LRARLPFSAQKFGRAFASTSAISRVMGSISVLTISPRNPLHCSTDERPATGRAAVRLPMGRHGQPCDPNATGRQGRPSKQFASQRRTRVGRGPEQVSNSVSTATIWSRRHPRRHRRHPRSAMSACGKGDSLSRPCDRACRGFDPRACGRGDRPPTRRRARLFRFDPRR